MSRDLNNYKTSLCWHFMNKGHCSLFDKCYFAHGQKQLRTKVDPLPQAVLPQFLPVSIYKTQLCKYFMKGYCRNDTQCSFAHGPADLHGMLITSKNPLPPPPQFISPQQVQNMRIPMSSPQPIMNSQNTATINKPFGPDVNQAGQFLLSIIKNLQQVLPQEISKKTLIQKGIKLIENGELFQANQIINQLVSSTTLTDKQKQQCNTILTNAYTLQKINFMLF